MLCQKEGTLIRVTKHVLTYDQGLQVSAGRLHCVGRRAAILTVLQKQSRSTDWRAAQQSEEGVVAAAPGTTYGAQELRLVSSDVQLCALLICVCTANAISRSSNAALALRETTDLIAAITNWLVCLALIAFAFFNSCVLSFFAWGLIYSWFLDGKRWAFAWFNQLNFRTHSYCDGFPDC